MTATRHRPQSLKLQFHFGCQLPILRRGSGEQPRSDYSFSLTVTNGFSAVSLRSSIQDWGQRLWVRAAFARVPPPMCGTSPQADRPLQTGRWTLFLEKGGNLILLCPACRPGCRLYPPTDTLAVPGITQQSPISTLLFVPESLNGHVRATGAATARAHRPFTSKPPPRRSTVELHQCCRSWIGQNPPR